MLQTKTRHRTAPGHTAQDEHHPMGWRARCQVRERLNCVNDKTIGCARAADAGSNERIRGASPRTGHIRRRHSLRMTTMNVSQHRTPNTHNTASTSALDPEETPPTAFSWAADASVAGSTCELIRPDNSNGAEAASSRSEWADNAAPSISINANTTLVMSLAVRNCSFSVADREVRIDESISHSLPSTRRLPCRWRTPELQARIFLRRTSDEFMD